MIVYHFTAFLHFPAIMQEGLTKGEVPVNATSQLPQAVNLTRIPQREKQSGWGALNNIMDKTKVRVSIEIDREEVLSFKEVRKKYKISPAWAKALGSGADPFNHFFFFGTIPPERFEVVSVWDDGYKPMTESDLAELVAKIDKEKKNLVFAVVRGQKVVRLKEGVPCSWLLDGGEGHAPR